VLVNKLLLAAGITVLLISTVVNAVMIRENRRLVSLASAFRGQLVLSEGDQLPPLAGVDLNGKSIVVDSKNEIPTVLFVFSPSCSVCLKNWQNWDSILSSESRSRWRPVFIDAGGNANSDFLQTHGLPRYAVVEDVTKETFLSYRLFSTPQTIVLSRDGKVNFIWGGALSHGAMGDLSQILASKN
jgi:hypothetical protein